MPTVAVLVGSLRRESINRKLAQALAKLAAPKGLDFRFIQIGDLPFYDDDLWADQPVAPLRFKAEVSACDAVLMVTPEFNRNVPAVLTNAFDWGTRPWGQDIWAGRPCALIGASPGPIGAAVAQTNFRAGLLALGLVLMGKPEFYFQYRPGIVDDANDVTDDATRTFLSGWLDSYVKWIDMVLTNR